MGQCYTSPYLVLNKSIFELIKHELNIPGTVCEPDWVKEVDI